MSKNLFITSEDCIIDLDKIEFIGEDFITINANNYDIEDNDKIEIIKQLIKKEKIVNPDKFIIDSLAKKSKISKEQSLIERDFSHMVDKRIRRR
tara:strand:- start:1122 stop:1403 length:282 start_codon:yes stop_codon:yes gene_type:complete